MLGRLGRWIDDFTTTIKEGYYSPADPVDEQGESLPRDKPWVMTGFGAFGIASALLSNTVIGLAIEASLIGVAAGICLAGLAGLGVMGALYAHCKKTGAEKISETNMAGQRVTGTRADLYKLHQAQRRIVTLTEDFQAAAPLRRVMAGVQDIIRDTAPERARVTVTDTGDAPADKKDYEFVRPVIAFTDAAKSVPAAAFYSTPAATQAASKKHAKHRAAAR